jgi:hypothetical protein
MGDHDVYATLVDAASQHEDEAAIRKYAPLSEGLATRYNHKLYLAITHRAWGVAHRLRGEYGEADERLNRAQDIFTSLKTRWQSGRTMFELGKLEDAQGNGSISHDYLVRALAAFEEMCATPDAERTRAALDKLSPA